MGENTTGSDGRLDQDAYESWLVQGLHDGQVWANSAAHSSVREFAINEDRTLPTSAGSLAVEYARRFADFDRNLYTRAWEAAIGLVWLRRRATEDWSARFETQ